MKSKLKLKLLITTFVLSLLFFNSICFATNSNTENMLIPDTLEPTISNSDLFITDSDYELTNTVNGNVFVFTDKFVLKPECQINGDLYICAKEVHLDQYSKISGNVFVCSTSLVLNAEINGSLYVFTKNFDMHYYGFIYRDLILYTKNATINGYIDRNTFIEAKKITTNDKFINQGNFTIKDADNFIFSGEILGDVTINSKNITFKSSENDNNLICKINGNLSYSSKKEINNIDDFVLKEIKYSKYKDSIPNIWIYILILIVILITIYVIYLLNKKKRSHLNK